MDWALCDIVADLAKDAACPPQRSDRNKVPRGFKHTHTLSLYGPCPPSITSFQCPPLLPTSPQSLQHNPNQSINQNGTAHRPHPHAHLSRAQLAQHDMSRDIINETAKYPASSHATTSTILTLILSASAYPSSSASASASASSKPRIRVLIQMIGTVAHRKCLIGGFCAITERVIGGGYWKATRR